jgi:hypothetical protein
VRRGCSVDVLTIRMPERFQDMLNDIPRAIRIYRTFPGPFYYLTFKYSRESSHETRGISPEHFTLWKLLSDIYTTAWKALNAMLIPDIYIEWLPLAIKKGKELIKKNRYDVIISSSETRVCHLAGYFLKKKSRIPWVADYGDPWIHSLPSLRESDIKKTILQKIEKVILKKIDAITVAADGMKTLYHNQYPFLNKESIHVVTQGFDSDMFLPIERTLTHKFSIVYCGSFYRDLRDPSAFFKAVMETDKDIEVIIAGRINEFADVLRQEYFHGRIQFRGFLSHKESLTLQKKATILLHIGNANDVQVPGKIYEYIGAGKPILCIKGGDGDISADIIMRYNKGIVVPNNTDIIKKAIGQLYELWEKHLFEKTFNFEPIEEYTWAKKAQDIHNIIENL